jgi:hypothetical protein
VTSTVYARWADWDRKEDTGAGKGNDQSRLAVIALLWYGYVPGAALLAELP